jgi:drug/metabolite transporter (DMT)-like permease
VGALAVGAVVGALVVRSGAGSIGASLSQVLGLDRLRAAQLGVPVIGAVLLTAGIGDLGGNVFFVLATQAGDFPVAVVLSSLYPVVTTLLAAVFLHERLRRIQLLGVVLATVSVVLLR